MRFPGRKKYISVILTCFSISQKIRQSKNTMMYGSKQMKQILKFDVFLLIVDKKLNYAYNETKR